jgi:hypothetical protein
MITEFKNWLNTGSYCSDFERIALQIFKRDLPKARVVKVRTAAKEADRVVVGVFYGDGKLPRYRFYAVAKDLHMALLVRDDSRYAPKIWR